MSLLLVKDLGPRCFGPWGATNTGGHIWDSPVRFPTGVGDFTQLFTKNRRLSDSSELEAQQAVMKVWRWEDGGGAGSAAMPRAAAPQAANLDSAGMERA